jgi:hypothetical protein
LLKRLILTFLDGLSCSQFKVEGMVHAVLVLEQRRQALSVVRKDVPFLDVLLLVIDEMVHPVRRQVGVDF